MPNKKRLFAIKDNSRVSHTPTEFFNSKDLAKVKRDELNGPAPEGMVVGTKRQFSVTYGPDHRKYKS